ncbi:MULTISPECIES: DUF6233 domain-containing protein [unclassified Streptomyces]|uniref:DUF6233 domain-containing protein n=1 Tax=unclassified Streptomyces TaxID=2593676 RepID=UPI00087F9405|nr:DUF6233 domain-containing protein [Streptomyces sp. 136MFCol5.1]SCY14984.1 hypothetical protein SAMN02745898_1011037 [Streptomyces sp. 136MFCol5.1]
MSESGGISDLDKNRALADWLEWQLRRTRNRIRELEIKERQERHGDERAQAEQSWKIQPKHSGGTATLHRGGCTLSPQLGFISREEAIIALNEPDIEACRICHPEEGLRVA